MTDFPSPHFFAPVSMEIGAPDKAALLADLRRQHDEYKLDSFLLAFPGGGWRSSAEYPPMEYFKKMARLFREVKDELAPEGIRVGWWVTLTIKSSPVREWQRIIRADGNPLSFASCPMEPGYTERFTQSVATFAAIAKPDFIIYEDDFSLHGGCFCQRHLDEFARREGRVVTREEIVASFTPHTQSEKALQFRWRFLMRDTLVSLATALRNAVNRESPEIPMGTCQPGGCDWDGDATAPVARALAGPNHRPFSRLYGTFYGGEDIEHIPLALLHPLYCKQHLPEDFICYHESDSFPHTRFFTSAASMRVITTAAISYGFDGALLQTQQLLDNPDEEPAYGIMHAQEKRRFKALHDAARQCALTGVRLRFNPMEPKPPLWQRCLAHFGIPYTTLESPVEFISGNQVAILDDDTLQKLFAKGLVLDGDAAKALFDRGYADLMGVDVAPDAVAGAEQFDLGGREVIMDSFATGCAGRDMHRAGFYAPRGNGDSFNLIPHPGAEVITRLVTFQRRELGIGMTRFINRLGGRIVVMGMGTDHNRSSSLYNYRRQQLIQEQLAWCSDSFAYIQNAARVFTIMNEATQPETAGFKGMLTLSNLNPDPMPSPVIHLPQSWRPITKIKRLDQDGIWQHMSFSTADSAVTLDLTLDYCRPEVLLFIQ